MKCFQHPETDAVGYCRNCGKALCGDCRRDVRGVVYCEDCLAATVAQQAVPGAPNPAVALALGFIPGVGAIYNGEYVKALVYIVIFGGLISVMDSPLSRGLEPLFGMLLAGFYFYMPIEAYQTAKRRSLGLAPLPPPGGEPIESKLAPAGPIILIVLGALFLLNTLDVFRWTWHISRFWPVVLIGIGAWLLVKRAR
ncbi:MAG: B-box zinc finger protein [Acidobacteria bacterium]|nr:B-box zinc finger protein [Acidobacteriota bacterium]